MFHSAMDGEAGKSASGMVLTTQAKKILAVVEAENCARSIFGIFNSRRQGNVMDLCRGSF
jgi:hypothetical protein